MGFKPEQTIYHLTFEEDTTLAGLEVRILSCTIKELNKITSSNPDATDEEAAKQGDEMEDLIVSKLVSWNIEDKDDNPVPVTKDGLETLEPSLLAAVIRSWQMAMVSVSTPLLSGSSNGRSLEEATLGLGSLSQSLTSSPKPS